MAECIDSLNFIGYLLANKLDQNNLIRNIVNTICFKNNVKTFEEIEELQKNIKIVIRQIFFELIDEYKNKRKQGTEFVCNKRIWY